MSSNRSTIANHLVVVIHGVGDPQPGATLNDFLRGAQAGQRTDAEIIDGVVWLNDIAHPSRKVRVFPVHYRTVNDGTQRQVFAEVFWGDVSQVRAGKLGVLRGIFDVLFGLRHVAYEAADQQGFAAKCLQNLTAAAAGMIRGPFAAVNGMLLLLWLIAALLAAFLPEVNADGPRANNAVLAITLTSAIFCGWFSRGHQGGLIGDCLRWMVFWSLMVASVGMAVAWGYHRGTNVPGELNVVMWHTMILLEVLGLVWLLQTTMVLLMFLFWAVARFNRRNHPPGLDVALLVTVMTVGLWGQIVPTAWRVVYLFANQLSLLPRDIGDQFQALFARSVPLMGMQWLMASSVVVVFALVSAWYGLWKRHMTARTYNKQAPAPRLLVHRAVQLVMGTSAFGGSLVVFFITSSELLSWPWRETTIGRILDHGNTIALSAAGIVGMAVVWTLPYLRVGIDIVFDIVTHFYRVPGHHAEFPYREQLCSRAEQVINHFHHPRAHSNSLTFVTHSQGSMVAVGVLNSTDRQIPWHAFDDVTLVTMGSPLRHLYQKYFGHQYPRLDAPFWQPLRNRVRLWINIFRVDDFVGTYLLEPGLECVEWDEMVLVDHPVDPLGHTEYWTDSQVIEALHAYNAIPLAPPLRLEYPFEEEWRRAA